MSKALITGSIGSIKVNVIGYSTTIAAQIESSQLQAALVHYVTKVSQNGITFTIQCASETELANIQKFIVKHQSQNATGSLNTLRIIYPYAKIDYTGFFTTLDGGAQKFDFAPQISLVMMQTQGLIDSKSTVYSTSLAPTTAQLTNPDTAEQQILGG